MAAVWSPFFIEMLLEAILHHLARRAKPRIGGIRVAVHGLGGIRHAQSFDVDEHSEVAPVFVEAAQ